MFNMHVVLYSACFYVVVKCYHAMLKHTIFVMHVYTCIQCIQCMYTVYLKKKFNIYWPIKSQPKL